VVVLSADSFRLGPDPMVSIRTVLTEVDYNTTSTVWAQDKWKGVFRLKWIFIKDVPVRSRALFPSGHRPLASRETDLFVIIIQCRTKRSVTFDSTTRKSVSRSQTRASFALSSS
jgi:hypothetical protein